MANWLDCFSPTGWLGGLLACCLGAASRRVPPKWRHEIGKTPIPETPLLGPSFPGRLPFVCVRLPLLGKGVL